jgi:hypothetical protein
METTKSLEAALAGAAIHILSITPIMGEDGTRCLIITFEFQYKSRGNYVWGNSVHMVPAEVMEKHPDRAFPSYRDPTPEEIVAPLIDKAIAARQVLEDPKDPGRYNYLKLEA